MKASIPDSEAQTPRLKELKYRQSDPIFILDEARKLGIKKVALETRQPDAS